MRKLWRKINWYDVATVGSLAGLARGLYLAWEPLAWIIVCGLVLFVSVSSKLLAERRNPKGRPE